MINCGDSLGLSYKTVKPLPRDEDGYVILGPGPRTIRHVLENIKYYRVISCPRQCNVLFCRVISYPRLFIEVLSIYQNLKIAEDSEDTLKQN